MQYTVSKDADGISLGKYLFDRLKLSRTLIRRAKQQDGIRVNGAPVRTSYVLRAGDQIQVHAETEGRVTPEPIPIEVVYEDDWLLVVDKPPGIVVHPVRDYTSGTLANGVAYHLLQRGEPTVVRPIQRIDRDTSGIVLFSKDPAVAGALAAELEEHKLLRLYVAFVHGHPEPHGTVSVPMRRVWGHPVAREAAIGARTDEQEWLLAEAEAGGRVIRDEWRASGQAAVTHWEVLRRWPGVAMLHLRLETGRTHQIRVHMAHLGHPLLGDPMYGAGGSPGRQALHAATLGFRHPITKQLVSLSAPLPADLVALQSALNGSLHE